MQATMLAGITLGVVVFLGAFLALLPRFMRRGLPFGVYVGERASDTDEAHRLAQRWTRGILAWTAVALAAQWFLGPRRGPLTAYPVALLVLLGGYFVEYVRSHRAARALAIHAPTPAAVAYVRAGAATRPLLPSLSLALSLGAGLLALGYTWFHLDDFPDRIPVHFNAAGRPDAYRPASFASIWMLPLLTLVFGALLPLFALLTARARRAVRRGDGGLSLVVQQRFRAMTANFLAIVAILMAALLTVLSIGSVRVAIGAAKTLPPLVPVIAILMVGLAVGGTAWMAFHLGQGGARLEQAAASAPLTNGLADNRHWVAGLFYVNRDDPSFLVEKRFGIGYTINFGNWRAVVLVVALLLVTLGAALAPHLLR